MKQYDEGILEAAAEITAAVAEEAELALDAKGANAAAQFLRTLYDGIAAEDGAQKPGGVFEIYEDSAGECRFRLKAPNGEVIAVSEGYKRRESCRNGAESVQRYALLAQLREL